MEFRELGERDSPPAARGAGKPSRIDSVVFARGREVLSGSLTLASMPRLLAAGVGDEGLLTWDVEGSVARDEMQRQREFLRVRTRFAPWMTCSRCLEPVLLSGLSSDTLFRLAATEAQAASEDRETDAVEVIAADPHLDLAALIEDEAILALPMAPAHEDCDWKAAAGKDLADGL